MKSSWAYGGIVVLVLAFVLAGCRGPQTGAPGPGQAEQVDKVPAADAALDRAEGENSASSKLAADFKGKDLLSGTEVEFKPGSSGRVTVLAFFSPG